MQMLISAQVLHFLKAGRQQLLNYTKPQLIQHQTRKKGFASAMAEALEKLEQAEALRKPEIEATKEALRQAKRSKQNFKKRKWEEYKPRNEETANESKRANVETIDRIKRKKHVLLLGYSGANYFGMQRNPGMETIEEELFKVMHKHKWISDESFEQAQYACFQRAARTDKGVSAARQVCSMKLPDELDIKAFNVDLPAQIRLFGIKRVTKGFNAKDKCNARTYTYTLPTLAFANHEEEEHGYEKFRLEESKLQRVRDVLQLYEGTKNFHNFTSRKNYHDPSAKRYIMSFSTSEPFLSPQGIEFLTLKVKGQSFMLHQIRKMVGLTIAIVRGHTTEATLERALGEERMDLPMAPGLGLVLDTVHYERYNERYGTDGIHEPLIWTEEEAQIQEFIEKYINATIYDTEAKERPMLEWVATLSLHSYDVRTDDASTETENKNGSKDDDNEE